MGRHIATALLSAAALPMYASAQCEPRWISTGAAPGVRNNVLALATLDPDGSGPLPDQLFAGGDFVAEGNTSAQFVARWDGSAWSPLGAGVNGPVTALATWDPDGAGPQETQLIVGGSFSTAGDSPANGVAHWDGTTWRALGTGEGGSVTALIAWDPDGAGPIVEQLFAGGFFSLAGGVASYPGVARWDGSAWQPVGELNGGVRAFAKVDPDGSGPQVEQLIVGGGFISVGGISANRIARWDGAAWHALGDGLNATVHAISAMDPDGDGPMPVQVVAGGSFTTAGNVSASRIALWNGASWQNLGLGTDGPVFALTTLDLDGPGPIPSQLFAAGNFSTAGGSSAPGVARWSGTAWQPLGAGIVPRQVLALTGWNRDEDGQSTIQLVVGGAFTALELDYWVHGVALWDGSAWRPVGRGLNSSIAALTAWDPDGAGPQPEQVIAGGKLTFAGGTSARRIARWDGVSWWPLGAGLSGPVASLATWDPDGAGPQADQLIVGGVFLSAGGVPARHVASWDGAEWRSLGAGVDGPVLSLATWDPDGAGPLPAQLIAGGDFLTAGNGIVRHIARWDGTSWMPLGAGISGPVTALITWDPDGAGPQQAMLVAAGAFATAGGVPANSVAAWNGMAWQPIGSGFDRAANALTTWDPDGQGPLPPQLIAGGEFVTSGGITVHGIARFDGTAWQPLGTGMSILGAWTTDHVRTLSTWDPDGAGPLPQRLIAGGLFDTAGGVAAAYVAMWDGATWRPLLTGMNNVVSALCTLRAVGPGARPDLLTVGGQFTTAGGLASGYCALFGCPSPQCAADVDGDGDVTSSDLSTYLEQFERGHTFADANADRAVTIDDLLDFVEHYLGGC